MEDTQNRTIYVKPQGKESGEAYAIRQGDSFVDVKQQVASVLGSSFPGKLIKVIDGSSYVIRDVTQLQHNGVYIYEPELLDLTNEPPRKACASNAHKKVLHAAEIASRKLMLGEPSPNAEEFAEMGVWLVYNLDDVCTFCHCDIVNNEICSIAPCGHRFHVKCCYQWLLHFHNQDPSTRHDIKCPMCQASTLNPIPEANSSSP